ncbi:MAG: type II toxin-antitoxin system RelE/ParE family toxin [Gammaproteobacteria bacterium]|nr:type II toxin-antitoxin system RelE/ParE family toxin [Gammaproteobacteria bacterium]
MSYRLSRRAEDEFVDLFVAGVSQFGIEQAERYHDLLEAAFAFLASNPFAARERPEITPPVRVHPVGAHLIVYTLNAAGDVFILRVRQGHEDWS